MRSASSTDTAATLDATSRPISPGGLAKSVTGLGLGARFRQVRAAVLVALGYYVGAKIGVALTPEPTSVSTLWPPDAILLAGLVLTPVRSWVAVCAAAFVAHFAVQLEGGTPLPMILGRYLSSSTGALVGAGTFRRLQTA